MASAVRTLLVIVAMQMPPPNEAELLVKVLYQRQRARILPPIPPP